MFCENTFLGKKKIAIFHAKCAKFSIDEAETTVFKNIYYLGECSSSSDCPVGWMCNFNYDIGGLKQSGFCEDCFTPWDKPIGCNGFLTIYGTQECEKVCTQGQDTQGLIFLFFVAISSQITAFFTQK